MIPIKISEINKTPLKLSNIKSEQKKINSSQKIIQQSYKTFERNIENCSQEVINHKISLLEDIVERRMKELLDILQKKYKFCVTTSSCDKNKIIVQLLDFNTKEVMKEIPAEDFLKMLNYIENIFYIKD